MRRRRFYFYFYFLTGGRGGGGGGGGVLKESGPSSRVYLHVNEMMKDLNKSGGGHSSEVPEQKDANSRRSGLV